MLHPSATFKRAYKVPPRSNKFQRLIRELYRSLAPTGAIIRESAMLIDGQTGIEREVDVLVEGAFAGHKMSMAVECRDYTRDQNIMWVDELIGKYRDLPVDKVVAVSSSEFSEGAKLKAASVNIECVTAIDAQDVDWAREVNPDWSVLTHRHWVHHFVTRDANEKEITHTTVAEDGSVEHFGNLSEKVFPTVVEMFRQLHAARVEQMLNDKIGSNLAKYAAESSKRYAEITFTGPRTIVLPEGPLEIGSVLYGVCSVLNVEKVPLYKKVINETAVTSFTADLEGTSFTAYVVSDKDGRQLGVSLTQD